MHDRAEGIAVEDRAAVAVGDVLARGRRARGVSTIVGRGEVDVGPRGDRRPGDVGAVVEAVGELGERAEAARQAPVDDLDAEPQRAHGAGDLGARYGRPASMRQVVRELERELALEPRRDEVGELERRRRRRARRASSFFGSGAAIGRSTPSAWRCASVTAATFQPPTAPSRGRTAACSR